MIGLTRPDDLGDDTLGSRAGRRSIFASGAGLFAVRIINAVLGLATVTVFARNLPPSDYGLYTLALTIAQFLSLPLHMGIPTLLTREIAIAVKQGEPNVVRGLQLWSRRMIAWGSLILGVTIVAIYALVLWAAWPVLEDFTWPLVLTIAALIPVLAAIKRVLGILSGFKRVAQSRIADGLVRPSLLLAAGSFGLIVLNFSVTGLLLTYLVAALSAVVFGEWLIRRAWPSRIAPVFQSEQWQKSLVPLTVFTAAGAIKTYSDVLMIGMLSTTEQVALYRVAYQISGVAMMVQVMVNAVLGPRVASLHATGNDAAVARLAVFGSRLAFGANFAYAFIILLVGEAGFSALFGPDYAGSYRLTTWLAFGFALNAFFGGTVLVLNMTRREGLSARYSTITAIANIVLNAALIPFFGAAGAVVATIATTLLMQSMAWNRVRKGIGLRTDALGTWPFGKKT